MERAGTAACLTSDSEVTVVELHGEVDFDRVEPLRERLRDSVESGADVVVDLAGVTFIDCASLGALVEAHQLARRRGHRLCLAAPRRAVRRTLAAAMLDTVFALYPDREYAVFCLSGDAADHA